MVDQQAKSSLSLESTLSSKIPFSNFKPSINKYILEEWPISRNNSIGNKFPDIKPSICEYQSVVRNIRKEEVFLALLRLGHTRVTHHTYYKVKSSHNVLVATHHSLYVTSFWNVATLHK